MEHHDDALLNPVASYLYKSLEALTPTPWALDMPIQQIHNLDTLFINNKAESVMPTIMF